MQHLLQYTHNSNLLQKLGRQSSTTATAAVASTASTANKMRVSNGYANVLLAALALAVSSGKEVSATSGVVCFMFERVLFLMR